MNNKAINEFGFRRIWRIKQLLQSATAFLLQNATILLQSATIITLNATEH